ncbi:MAG: tetratricopeptide repeat protein, partial [Planctomycetota bacterium]
DQTKPDPKDLIGYHEHRKEVSYLIYHKRLDEAKTICEKMLEEWPHMPDTHLELGRITYKKGKFAESIVHNTKYLALIGQPGIQHPESLAFDPNKPTFMVHEMLGGAYYQLGQHDKAVKHYAAALLVRPDRPDVHSNIAVAYFDLGKFNQAVRHWSKALQLKPDRPDVHDNLAIVLYKQGRIDEAIAHWTEALRLKPDWTEVREKLDKVIQQKRRLSGGK